MKKITFLLHRYFCRSHQMTRYAIILISIALFSISTLLLAKPPAAKTTKSDRHILTLTWVDLAFINHVPIPNTRFADFSDVNFGGFIGLNFMILDFKPLWLFTGIMVDGNVTNSNRLDRIIDFGIAAGVGWRFPLMKKFFLTPRVSYGYMFHSGYGYYYNDPHIYVIQYKNLTKKYHWFSDQYMQYGAEFAYDVSQPSGKVKAEIFFSPSFIHFMERHRQGLEIGYKLGFRMKVNTRFKKKHIPPAILAGKVIDAETGRTLKQVIPSIKGGKADKINLARGETFSFKVDPEEDYTLKAEYQGYNPVTSEVDDKKLTPDKKTIVILKMKPSRIWGIYGHVFKKKNKNPLKNVDVIVIDKSTGEEKIMSTDRKGNFRMELKRNTDYDVLLKKRNYFTVRGEFTSKRKKPGWFDITKFMRTEFQKVKINAILEFANIYYDTGSARLRPDTYPSLNRMAQFLKDNSTIVVEIGAHTDALGNAQQNMVLSQKRAESAVAYLIKKGIKASRLAPKGYGETKIKNRCVDGVACSAKEHQVNRRTEIRVTKILR